MILSIVHIDNWRYIFQRKEAQIYKDVIHKNYKTTNHNYRVWDQVLVQNNSVFKYEIPFKGPYEFLKKLNMVC